MSPNRSNVRVAQVVLVLITLLALPSASAEGSSRGLSVVYETDADKAQLLLDAFSDAINKTCPLYVCMATSCIADSAKAGAKQRFVELSTARAKLEKAAGESRLTSEAIGIERTDANLRVDVRICVCTPFRDRCMHMLVEMERIGGQLLLAKPDSLFEATSSLLDRAGESARAVACDYSTEERKRGASRRSDAALIPTAIYGDIYRVNHSFHEEVGPFVFDGSEMFNQPYGVAAASYDDPLPTANQDFLVVTDFYWDRLINSCRNRAHDSTNNFCQARGRHGSGDLEFHRPMGVAYALDRWFIADYFNKRVQSFSMDWDNGSLTHQYNFTGGFGHVADVAAAKIGAGSQVAIVDQGNAQVHIYDAYANYQRTLYGMGQKLTGVCFARNRADHQPMSYIYVVDDEDNTVCLRETSGTGQIYSTEYGVFPENARLTSVTVDAYCNVYVLDQRNSQVYLFNPGLDELIYVYGSTGSGDNQLYYPNRMAAVQKWVWDEYLQGSVPAPVGEIVFTERYGTTTGIRSVVPGMTTLWREISYRPQYAVGLGDKVRMDWSQTAMSSSRRRLYVGDSLLMDSSDVVNYPGTNYQRYSLSTDAPDSVYYRYVIDISSKFDPSISVTIVDSIYVERYVCPNPDHPVVADEFVAIDMEGDLNTACIYKDPSRYWAAIFDIQDQCGADSATFLLTPGLGSAMSFYTDTLEAPLMPTQYWGRQHNDESDTVFFTVNQLPSNNSHDRWRTSTCSTSVNAIARSSVAVTSSADIPSHSFQARIYRE